MYVNLQAQFPPPVPTGLGHMSSGPKNSILSSHQYCALMYQTSSWKTTDVGSRDLTPSLPVYSLTLRRRAWRAASNTLLLHRFILAGVEANLGFQ